MELCGECECPNEDDEFYGECICSECAATDSDRACDGLTADDWVMDVRVFNATRSEEDEFDDSEIVVAAAGLVPPLAQFATPTRSSGSAEDASHRSDDGRRAETRA